MAQNFTYDELVVGQQAVYEVSISAELIGRFATLSGDHNPLHVDAIYAVAQGFKGQVAHGMIAGALFSRLLGMELPGSRCVYLSQELKFHAPMYAGDIVLVKGTIIHKTDSVRTVDLMMEVCDKLSGHVRVRGEAKVRVLS